MTDADQWPPIVGLKTRVERLWERYCEARKKAETSHNIADGVAAGRAWAEFIQEFQPPDRRNALIGSPTASTRKPAAEH